jgi:hypothetical protein
MAATVVSETETSWISETGGTPVLLHNYGFITALAWTPARGVLMRAKLFLESGGVFRQSASR